MPGTAVHRHWRNRFIPRPLIPVRPGTVVELNILGEQLVDVARVVLVEQPEVALKNLLDRIVSRWRCSRIRISDGVLARAWTRES
jgi:hypothetical protein